MVISRVGNKNIDKETLEWLEKLAEKGEVTDEELQDALAEYERQASNTEHESYDAMRERYKREKAKENFESGSGGFRRSK